VTGISRGAVGMMISQYRRQKTEPFPLSYPENMTQDFNLTSLILNY